MTGEEEKLLQKESILEFNEDQKTVSQLCRQSQVSQKLGYKKLNRLREGDMEELIL